MKNPTLILCDEVTSSVDAFAERDIVDTLRRASEQRTTLTGMNVTVSSCGRNGTRRRRDKKEEDGEIRRKKKER